MIPERLAEIDALRITNDAPLPWTVEDNDSRYRHVCDARGNIIAAVPRNAGDLAERIVKAFVALPELLECVAELKHNLRTAVEGLDTYVAACAAGNSEIKRLETELAETRADRETFRATLEQDAKMRTGKQM